MSRLLITSLLTFATFAGVAVTGCGTKAPYPVRSDPYAAQQVYFTPNRISKAFRVGNITTARDPSDLLYVTVPIRSTATKRQLIEYRFTFFDDTGTPLPGGAWQTADLEPNVLETIRGNSVSPRAADFQLDVREAEAG